jgi:hypothetical protein
MLKIAPTNPPEFPTHCITNEMPPRKIKILGTAAIDPDVWVAEIEGDARPAWVVKSTGGICHPTAEPFKHRVMPWIEPEHVTDKPAEDQLAKAKAESAALRKNFAQYLVPAYIANPVEIARICDEEIDQTGRLLGYVRKAAAEAKRSL